MPGTDPKHPVHYFVAPSEGESVSFVINGSAKAAAGGSQPPTDPPARLADPAPKADEDPAKGTAAAGGGSPPPTPPKADGGKGSMPWWLGLIGLLGLLGLLGLAGRGCNTSPVLPLPPLATATCVPPAGQTLTTPQADGLLRVADVVAGAGGAFAVVACDGEVARNLLVKGLKPDGEFMVTASGQTVLVADLVTSSTTPAEVVPGAFSRCVPSWEGGCTP